MDRNEELLADLNHLVHEQEHLMRLAFATHYATKKTPPSSVPADDGAMSHCADSKIPVGSCLYVWKPEVLVNPQQRKIRKVYLPHKVSNGPSDCDFQVVLRIQTASGIEERDVKSDAVAKHNSENDFLPDIEEDPFAFDLVHTYTVCRMALDLCLRDLRISDWHWQWDLNAPPGTPKTPIRIIAHAGDKANAVYHRGKRVLKFYFFTPPKGKTTYLCRGFDIVAHETGHAILDALKPDLYSIHVGQAGALHESFGDLLAMFVFLSQLDLCEDVVAETKCDLRRARNVTAVGLQYAEAVQKAEVAARSGQTAANTPPADGLEVELDEAMGVRDANNTVVGSDVRSERDMYGLANVFSSFVFDVLVELFQSERNPKFGASDAETLHRVSRIVRRIVLWAFYMTDPVPTFAELSFAMEKAAEVVAADEHADEKKIKRIISRARVERQLEVAGQRPRQAVNLGDF